jgi:type IV pilus assembly protein PilV
MSERSFMPKPSPAAGTQQGVVMIEVMVAILIFSVGVLAIVGLQATMIKSTADAKYRADASYIAQSRIGQIWADPANAANYVETNTDISTLLPSGTRSVTQVAPGQFTVVVTWQQPGPNPATHNFTTAASVTGG